MRSSFSQQKMAKPKTLACYICGRQFGTKSLTLHLKPCKEKFKILQDQKVDKSLKIKLPDPPLLLQTILSQAEAGCLQEEILQQYNQQARNTHKYIVLPACKYCGRTFNEESLASHMKACPKKSSYTETAEKDHSYKINDEIKKPRTLVCCVCGRQFGITSLKIHYPQCQEKFRNEELKKTPKQRNPVPQFSQQDLQMVNGKTDWSCQQINQFNQKASTNFRNKAMVQCENCKRKFLPQSYKRHEKNCKLINGDKIASKSPSKQGQCLQSKPGYDIKELKKPKVLMCHICGRQFGLTSLKIHQKNCAEKFINEEKKRAKNERRPVPEMSIDLEEFDINYTQKWSIQKIQEYNQAANQVYKGCSLFPCEICGRKFFEDALKKHFNYCQKNAEDKKLKQQTGKVSKEKEMRGSPKKFEQNINNVHSNKSLVKQQQSKSKKSSDDFSSTSKTLNIKPTHADIDIPDEKPCFNNTIKQVNEELEGTLKETFNQNSLEQPANNQTSLKQPAKNNPSVQNNSEQIIINRVECSKCGRKFAEDRIQKHENICKGTTKKAAQIHEQKLSQLPTEAKMKNKTRKIGISPVKMNQSQFKDFQEQQPQKQLFSQLEECLKCGKKFMPSKIQKHISKCKDVAFKIKHKENKSTINQQPDSKQSSQIIQSLNPNPVNNSQKQQKLISSNKIIDNIKQDLANSHHKSRQISNHKSNSFRERQPQILKQTLPQQRDDQKFDLLPCRNCGRKFASDRVQKHEKVCKASIKKQELNIQKPFGKKTSKIEENQLFKSQQKNPPNNKKNMFNIKPVNKKIQEKKFIHSNQKDGIQKNMVKENIKFTQDLMNEIWDTKESPNRLYNASQALKSQKMVQGAPKVNKTAYEGGFYKRKPQREFSQEKDKGPKLEQIDNLQRVECKKCGRKFIEERIKKHQQICKQTNQTLSNVQKPKFNRYLPQSRQDSSKKLITQKQSSQISQSIILPGSKDVIKTIKEIKNMKINESYIDKELEKELEVINRSKPLKEIKSTGFGARNTYGGGEKFYSKQSNKKLDRWDDIKMDISENQSVPYQSKFLQPIQRHQQITKNISNQTNLNIKNWNK